MVVRSQDVVINEIMYHPASENLRESYIELYNPGTLETDLSGWRFTKGLPFVFPTNTMLGPGGYLVVAGTKRSVPTRLWAYRASERFL